MTTAALTRPSASLALMALLVPATSELFAQRRSPAEGPWSGSASCVVVAKNADYHEEQIHTWTLTGAPPTPAPRGSAQVYFAWPATWSVQGTGRKALPSPAPGRTAGNSERWAIAAEMNISLRITEVSAATDRLRIGAEGQRGAPLGSLRVTDASGRTRDASVQPWPFPAIEDRSPITTISGTSTRTYPEGFGVGWGQPRSAITTATCTWSFTRAGVSLSSQITSPQIARPTTGGRSGLAGAGAVTAPVDPPARTVTLAGFTGAGFAAPAAPRSIALAGFSAMGGAAAVPPRTIRLAPLTAVGGSVPSSRGPT
jgi:hypothetical protein